MRLEEYWGVGPKTRETLVAALGEESAVSAIEAGDVGALVDAGIPRGRATRILRHTHGSDALDVLATPDTRAVYNEVLDLLCQSAVTERASHRIRILTPLGSTAAIENRLDNVIEARDYWRGLDGHRQDDVLEIFETYDDAVGTEHAGVDAVLALREAGFEDGLFAQLADIDTEALASARDALVGFEGDSETDADRTAIGAGADDRLDELRDTLGAIEDAVAAPGEILETVQAGARDTGGFREAFVAEVTDRTDIDVTCIREAMPEEAIDAPAFIEQTLRQIAEDLRNDITDREREVADRLSGILEATRSDIDTATQAIDEITFTLSLGRFAATYDLERPTLVEGQVLAVEDARNLFLAAADEPVQPITYAVGDHSLSVASANRPPTDRVAVLTGANSGGKTTLLETLCQVQLLAQMGLPVPAADAAVGLVDSLVFHRRHASFNAGVLESTLRTVVPPVTAGGRALMLVDEFEAITEPGRAAELLHGLVTLTVDQDALGVFVTHLADDLEPLPDAARVDGIFAEGLTRDLELEVDYQPRFETVGRSTPEFIVSRLVANATDRTERVGYEHLAEAVGERAVQRTLSDTRWET